MIITITLNPAVDKTIEIDDFCVGSVNRVSTQRTDAGGKGINVSKVIRSLEGSSKAVGILGGTAGTFIKEYMDSQGIENDFVFIEGETRTNIKIVDNLRRTNTDINEPGPDVKPDDIERVREKVLNSLDDTSVVVFSGSVPANVDKSIYGKWITEAKKAGAKTILDADGELLKKGIEAGPFLIKPNIHELEKLFGTELKDIKETEKLARGLIENYGIEMVAVSLGERGAIFLNKKSSVLVHGIKVDVKSTVGAGDSMVAALAYSIDRAGSFEKAIRLAVAAGTANVMTAGSQAAEYKTVADLEEKIYLEYL
jgi:1-phosphofructokinase